MSAVTFAGIPVLSGRVVIPFAGLWHASLVLSQPVPSTGTQTLLLGASPYLCTPVRDITFSGRRGILAVGGSGGWRASVPPKQYGQGVVPVQAILTDVAAACGELPPVGALGTVSAYCRKGSPSAAGTALQELLGDGWWCSSLGVVQAYARPASVIASDFQAMAVDGAAGVYEIATESPEDWQPGASFAGPTVSGVVSRAAYVIEPDKFRVEVMVS